MQEKNVPSLLSMRGWRTTVQPVEASVTFGNNAKLLTKENTIETWLLDLTNSREQTVRRRKLSTEAD